MKNIVFIIASLALSTLSFAAGGGDINSQVLAEINLARTAPQEYAHIIAERTAGADKDSAEAIRFLEKARPLPALAPSTGLAMGARLHVDEQGPTGGTGHGSNPFGRMNRFGQRVGMAGENISYGKHDARGIVCQLIVDHGVSDRGHRKNIFGVAFGQAGVAFGPHASFGAMCVIDFATRFVDRGQGVASL